jgi:hypothetical protein
VSRSISAAQGSLWLDGAVIVLAVTVLIDAVGKTLHEPHRHFR